MNIRAAAIHWLSDLHQSGEELPESLQTLSELSSAGFPVAPGFVLTPQTFTHYLQQSGHHKVLKRLTTQADPRASQQVINQIATDNQHALPAKLETAIRSAYKQLTDNLDKEPSVTAINVINGEHIGPLTSPDALIRAIALLYSKRLHTALRGTTQPFIMVQLFDETEAHGTLDIDAEHITIESSRGSKLHGGHTTHFDTYVYDTNSIDPLRSEIGEQSWRMTKKGKSFFHQAIGSLYASEQKINRDQQRQLAQLAKAIYVKNDQQPLHIGWVLDTTGSPWLTLSDKPSVSTNELTLVQGKPGTPGWVTGQIRHMNGSHPIDGEQTILVTHSHRLPEDIGLDNCLGVIFSSPKPDQKTIQRLQQLGIPSVVGIDKPIAQGLIVTLDGGSGTVYPGRQKHGETSSQSLAHGARIYGSIRDGKLTSPEKAVDGIGLWGIDPHISRLGTHPRHYLQQGMQREYIDLLANDLTEAQVGTDTLPLIMKTSQLSPSDYRKLQRGENYEKPEHSEAQYRGGRRYRAEPDLFKMEIEAIQKAHARRNTDTLQLALPYVRSLDELAMVSQLISATSVERDTLQLWLICETPATAFDIAHYCENGTIHGVIIDLATLSALTTGSEPIVGSATIHPAVVQLIQHVVTVCRDHDIPVLILDENAATQPQTLETVLTQGANGIIVPMTQAPSAHALSKNLEAQLHTNALLELLHR
jgi:pyruvate,water dikinase